MSDTYASVCLEIPSDSDEFENQCPGCTGANRPAPVPCLNHPTASEWVCSSSRRLLDIMVSVIILTIAAVPMFLIALLICATSRGGAFFVQERVGRNGKMFRMYKFRSMKACTSRTPGPIITRAGDERVTPVGRVLRRLKLDELPQFYNVLRGEMSLVGPRPKLPNHEGIRRMPYRPGITGEATLLFRREEDLLRDLPLEEMEEFYEREIKVLKAHVDVSYMSRATLMSDLRILASTVGLMDEPPSSLNGNFPIGAK